MTVEPNGNALRVLLYGAHANDLREELQRQSALQLVQANPDVIVCYGGDGTLLSAELAWPGVPKAPIRNSRRGNRCMGHPPGEILERLAQGGLHRSEYVKLQCAFRASRPDPMPKPMLAMNEINVHMGRINTAVRFKLWIDGDPFENGLEIIGDGFVVSTPFGSTAYFNQITRGVFHTGIGVAFKYTSEQINHLVLPDAAVIHAEITRGPAILAHDNAPEYVPLQAGDVLTVSKSPRPAIILTWTPMKYPSDQF